MHLWFLANSGLFLQLWTIKYKLATYKKVILYSQYNSYLFLDLLDSRFGPASSVKKMNKIGENKVAEFVVDVHKVVTLYIVDLKLTIITISDKFGQLGLCSLLFFGFLSRPSLDLIGRIQLTTHDSTYTNTLKMERESLITKIIWSTTAYPLLSYILKIWNIQQL